MGRSSPSANQNQGHSGDKPGAIAAFDLSVADLLVPDESDRDRRHRLGQFADWLLESGHQWYQPDLAVYRDALLGRGLAASSVRAHLSTVRGQYKRLLKDNVIRTHLYEHAAAELQRLGQDDTPANRKAMVDEILERLDNAIDPAVSRVRVVKHQDRPDTDHHRLTRAQAEALINAPGVDTIKGLRDTAILAILLCTGVREAEVCHLEVRDLRQQLGGELALHVREGKGAKERLVPYGDLSWALAIVEKWLAAAGIADGPVFRAFWRDGESLRPGGMTVRAIQLIVGSYPIAINGDTIAVSPHDLRRTYARRLYEAGVDLVAIQQNLGHADLRTTLGYIGALDADERRAPALYSFDLRKLQANS